MIAGQTRQITSVARTSAILFALGALIFTCASAGSQGRNPSVPFDVGEQLDYRVKVPLVGTVGRAVFRVEGPLEYRGTDVVLLRSDITTKWGPIRGNSTSSSWFDPWRMLSLRFSKDERQPAYRDAEDVEMYPEARRFEQASGPDGEMPTDEPLDELSFIYFLRTMSLEGDSTLRFARHYDTERNPVTVRLVKREKVKTELGEEPALLVEMRVRHPRHYRGEGVIRIHLSDDARRVPLKIESNAPATGKVTLVLERYTPPTGNAVAELGKE